MSRIDSDRAGDRPARRRPAFSAGRLFGCLLCLVGVLGAVVARAATISVATSIATGDLAFDGQDVVIDGATVEMSGPHAFGALRLVNGAILTHPPGAGAGDALRITATSVTVDASSSIDVSGKSQVADSATGADPWGGSHGGRGGAPQAGTSSPVHGDPLLPRAHGEGMLILPTDEGGTVRTGGGGALQLVTGELLLDGAIRADGSASLAGNGGGAGGSLLLEVTRIAGGGEVSADGGRAAAFGLGGGPLPFDPAGGGGGGRIALYFDQSAGFDVDGRVHARGAVGVEPGMAGSAGTVYLHDRTTGQRTLRVDNGATASVETTPVAGVAAERMQFGGNPVALVGTSNSAADIAWLGGAVPVGAGLRIDAPLHALGGQLRLSGDFAVRAAVPLNLGSAALVLDGSTRLGQVPGQAGGLAVSASRIAIAASARIDVSASGNGPAAGIGQGSGASHGGTGGVAPGGSTNAVYGVAERPTALGTGAPAPSGSQVYLGGGAVRLVADHLQLDGAIRARGADGGLHADVGAAAGGSSGGSVWLDVGGLAGSGFVDARGGSAGAGAAGGGGGGRIALSGVAGAGFDPAGQLLVAGGNGHAPFAAGSAGTLVLDGQGTPGHLLAAGPTGLQTEPVTTLYLTFDQPMDPGSLTAVDIVLTGPGGAVAIGGVQALSSTQLAVSLVAPLQVDGHYRVTVGPDVLTVLGVAMDQDGDGTPGEHADDVFGYTFDLDVTAPPAPAVQNWQPLPGVNIVAGNALSIQGAREAGATILLDGVEVVAAGDTAWSYALSAPEGITELRFTARDGAGHESPGTALRFVVDTTPPVVLGMLPAADSRTREAPEGLRLVLQESGSGVDLPASQLAVTRDGAPVAGSWADVNGTPTFAAQNGFDDGHWQIQAVVLDRAGHQAGAFAGGFHLDRVPPAQPVVQPLPEATNRRDHLLAGTREADSGILLNGAEIVPLGARTAWEHALSLVPGQNLLVVEARDAAGNRSAPVELSVSYTDEVPGPVALTATAGESGTDVFLEWAYDEEAGGGDVARYEVYRATAPFTRLDAATGVQTVVGSAMPPNGLGLQVSGLTRDTDYYFAVVAVDAAGQMLQEVTPVLVTTVDRRPPGPVRNLHVESHPDHVVLHWEAPSGVPDDFAGYQVHIDDQAPVALDQATLNHTVAIAGPPRARDVRLHTRDLSGNESDPVQVTAVTLLDNPAGLVVTPFDGKVRLDWTRAANVGLVQQVEVFVDTSPFASLSGREPRLVRGPETISAQVGQLGNGTPYHFAVAVRNLNGNRADAVNAVEASPLEDEQGPQIGQVRYADIPLEPGGTLSANGPLVVTASDPAGVARVEFLLDDTLFATDLNAADGFVAELDIGAVDDGARTLSFLAYDAHDNPARRDIQVTVALGAPDAPHVLDPALDAITNTPVYPVRGRASAGTGVTLYRGTDVVGGPVPVDGQGLFLVPAALLEGPNELTARARHAGGRGGDSAPSAPFVLTLDTTVPDAPVGLRAESRPGGLVALSWNTGNDPRVQGYRVLRAAEPFATAAAAVQANSAGVTVGRFDDLPPADGLYHYRVLALNELGTPSALSNAVQAVSDQTRPRALEVRYQPARPPDASGALGTGQVIVEVEVSEPLLVTPFLSLATEGGTPLNVGLARIGDTTYRGSVEIDAETVSGEAHAVFSGRDLVGNRGDVIDTGGTVPIDTSGPAIVDLQVVPPDPIRNAAATPLRLSLALRLDQAVAPGTGPELSYLLSGPGRSATAVSGLTQVDAHNWQAVIDLPADAGLAQVETLTLALQARDALGNIGTRIHAAHRFQVYQGELPPLPIPGGLTATTLPGGAVQLDWQPVDGAGGYEIWRQGPAATGLTPLQRNGTTRFTDSPGGDGEYRYAVASLRLANEQEAVSELSAAATAIVDSVAPERPQGLFAELTPAGVMLSWAAAPGGDDETLTYRVYRTAGQALDDVSGLTPLQSAVPAEPNGLQAYLDAVPSRAESVYAVTAVDPAGNESAPGESAYLNIDLLPVATLRVTRTGDGAPVVAWTHPGGNIVGFNLYTDTAPDRPVIASPLGEAQFIDFAYPGGVRTYRVAAVDANGVESLARAVTLVPLSVAPDPATPVRRGVFNAVRLDVANPGDIPLEGLTLHVNLHGATYSSEAFDLPGGGRVAVPVVVGGNASLPDLAAVDVLVRQVAPEGEVVEQTHGDALFIGQDALVAQLEARTLTRGTASLVRFQLSNTSDVETELLTAAGGGAPSPEIRLRILDAQGNLVAITPFTQILGAGVVNTPDGRSVARIAPGATFTSAWFPLPIPVAAPDEVGIQLVIDSLHHRLGRDRAAAIGGLSTRLVASLRDTPYDATLDSVTPAQSTRGEPVVIAGRALDRLSGQPLANVPVGLVIAGNGFERGQSVNTGPDGHFSYTHRPLDGESGRFLVSAIHPDMVTRPAQGSFTVSRILVSPQTLQLTVARNYRHTEQAIRVETGAATTASGVHLRYVAEDQPGGVLPEGVELTVGDAVDLPERHGAHLPFTLSADNSAHPAGSITLKVLAQEQGTAPLATVNVEYRLVDAAPVVQFEPNFVETGVAHGASASELLTLSNQGLADLLDVQLSLLGGDDLPAPDWLRLGGGDALGTLAIGAQHQLQITAVPDGSVPEGVHAFRLRVAGSNAPPVDINVFVAVTQSGEGGILFKATDIYTATLDGNDRPIPGLAGARIKVQNEAVLSVEQTLSTDAFGEALFSGLPAGRYRYRASAPNHADSVGRFEIKPGIVSAVETFLDYNLVTVEWSVTETTLQDSYEIVLQALFETDVPAAVVVIEPGSTTLPPMQAGDVYSGEFRLRNHGLIRADDLAFEVPTGDPYFRYELLDTLPGSLAAKQSLVIPYRVTSLAPMEPDGTASGGGCTAYTRTLLVRYGYVCTNGTLANNSGSHTWTVPVRADINECGGAGSVLPSVIRSSGGTQVTQPGSGYAALPQSLPGASCQPTPDCQDGSCCGTPRGHGGGGQ